MLDTIITSPTIDYFTTDTDALAMRKAKYLLTRPAEAEELVFKRDEDLYSYIVGYMRNIIHTNGEAVKAVLHSMDMFDKADNEKMELLLENFLKDHDAKRYLLLKYQRALKDDFFYVENRMNEELDRANEQMKADGFLGDKEKYIILDLPSKGQQTMRWYHVATISKVQDMVKVLGIMSGSDSKHDYSVTISRPTKGTPWLTGTATYLSDGHFETDRYRFIPVKWVKRALEDEYNQELFSKLHVDVSRDFEE